MHQHKLEGEKFILVAPVIFTLVINKSGSQIPDAEDKDCKFKKIKRLPNGSYFVHAECGDDGGINNEDMVFSIEDKQLIIKRITIRFCVSVIEPPPTVVQDPEYDPDGWLGLREGPGKQFKIITALGGYEYLEADATNGDWTHISNVTRLSAYAEGYHPKIYQGWVRSKYVKKVPCENETASEPDDAQPTVTPQVPIIPDPPKPGPPGNRQPVCEFNSSTNTVDCSKQQKCWMGLGSC